MIISYGMNDEPCPYCGSAEAHHECEYLTPPQTYIGISFDDDESDESDGVEWCEHCNGTGQDWDLMPCHYCDGEGYLWWL